MQVVVDRAGLGLSVPYFTAEGCEHIIIHFDRFPIFRQVEICIAKLAKLFKEKHVGEDRVINDINRTSAEGLKIGLVHF